MNGTNHEDWKGATVGGAPLGVYASAGKAVLMDDTAVSDNTGGLTPEPGDGQDPCAQKVDVTVQKVWNDGHNADGKRPDSITVQLTATYTDANGKTHTPETIQTVDADGNLSGEKIKNPITVTLSTADQSAWTDTWRKVVEDLPVAIKVDGEVHYLTYTPTEVTVGEGEDAVKLGESGYTVSYTVDAHDRVITITNSTPLPETGGMGAHWFAILGVLIVGVGILLTRKDTEGNRTAPGRPMTRISARPWTGRRAGERLWPHGQNQPNERIIMLRNMKAKALALLTALAMTLGLGAVATAPAYAAGADGSIAVTGNDAFERIDVYQMFKQEGDGESAKYTLTDTWEGFFTADSPNGIGLTDDDHLSDAAYTHVKNLGADNAQAVSDFAKKAAAWAADNSITATNHANVAEGTKTATVSNLAYGYYLVVPSPKGSTPKPEDPYQNRGTDAMLVNVNSGTPVKMDLKTVYPTVEKKVNNENHASASVAELHPDLHGAGHQRVHGQLPVRVRGHAEQGPHVQWHHQDHHRRRHDAHRGQRLQAEPDCR